MHTFIRVDRERSGSHFNRAFNAECVEFSIRIKDPNDVETVPYVNLYEWRLHVFEELLEWGTRRAEPHHFVGIIIGIPDAVNTRSIGLDFRPISSLSAEILADLLQNVMQSNDEFGANNRIEITMTIVRIPSGGAMVKLNKLNTDTSYVSNHAVLLYKMVTLLSRKIKNVWHDHLFWVKRWPII